MNQLSRGLCILLAGLGLFVSNPAYSASLILFQDKGESNPIKEEAEDNLRSVMVQGNLKSRYSHLDSLSGERALPESLFQKIRERSQEGPVDVLIVSKTGEVSASEIARQGKIENLELVLVLGKDAKASARAWQGAGAASVLTQRIMDRLPGFYFSRFVSRLGEGATPDDAADDAERFAIAAANEIGNYLKHPSPAGSGWINSPALAPQHEHTDFEAVAIELYNLLLPLASLDSGSVPNFTQLVDRAGSASWAQLQNIFPAKKRRPKSKDEIWIDGGALRLILSGKLKQFSGATLREILDNLSGIRLVRGTPMMKVTVFFNRSLTIEWTPKSQAQSFRPYGVYFPETIELQVSMQDGHLHLVGLADSKDPVRIQVKIPVISDDVYIRDLAVDMASGEAQVEAGVMGNIVKIVGKGQIYAKRFEGVDIWDTIDKNASIIAISLLMFLLV